MQNDLEEVLSSYDQLIISINDSIPFISEPISFLGIEFTIAEVVLPVVFLILINLLGNLVRSILINKVLGKYIEDRKTILSIGNTTKYIILFFGLLIALTAIGIDKDSSLNFALGKTGEDPLMLFELLRVIFLLVLLVFLSGKLKIIFVKQVMSRYSDDIGVNQSIGTIFQYVAVLIGGLIIIQSTIELGSLNVLAGALGVGIGFGLQNIANNFISGLIILFERPIKVGDRIEVGQVTGDIVRISSRATTVSTNDNISIIIPNAEFISKPVINWSHSGRNIRFHVPVGVAYKEDPAHIKSILLGIATKHPDVLQTPPPDVLFKEYGDNSLNFDLLVWTSTYINRPTVLKSQLYYLIFEKFKEHNVEIPFPQRDIHIKSGSALPQK
ncbi:mechanosensitive ion channel-like protein [Roseivirga ehrenbergii]|uniref:mechanosensitive ion channel family protein n=1 Tax=Roseivirga ehrenbergii (strain DSM 102268 / JCM 13514 / KCTC 12282 / NCIMB 14502 / KMM 6017) TaxID=279360 RepID=UPI000A718534|nr:mechanosensitive ion channel domain-containing protein [Roseivirga ehrenbergii]TCL13236.1 mechanosensitive ion channel-like protein [Roseivirga ehrenbergii]